MIAVGGVAEQSSGGAPPASREARFNLDMKTIGEKGLICLICQEDFPANSKAKVSRVF